MKFNFFRKTVLEQAPERKMSIVPFEDPDRVDTASIYDYQNVIFDDAQKFFKPPVDRKALAELPHINGQHGGILRARSNMVSADFVSGGGMTFEEMHAAITNLLTFGDVAFLKIRNRFGEVIRLLPLPSLYLRRKKSGGFAILQKGGSIDYRQQDIIFIKLYDPRQQIYGIPDYLGGIQSAMLNREATVFRRRYFKNGAHMGFILYTTDPNISEDDEDEIQKKIEDGRGAGNFKSLFINIPRGDKDGVKVIPIGETSAKDEFSQVKAISMQDVLNAHRFPPGLAGMIPSNVGGFSDPEKARATYRKDEVFPLQKLIANAVARDAQVPADLRIVFCDPDAESEEKSA